MSKKKWRKPEVIVLTRTKSEETVLQNCKKESGENVDPIADNQGCTCDFCDSCFIMGES